MLYGVSDKYDNCITRLIEGTADQSIVEIMDKISDVDDTSAANVFLFGMICIERKEYTLAEKIFENLKKKSVQYNAISKCDFLEIYNEDKREFAEQDFINTLEYYFEIKGSLINEKQYYASSFGEYREPLYHLVKNSCYKAVEAYLNKAELFELDKDTMSFYIMIAAKKRDTRMLKIFAEKRYCLRSYDMAYLILYDEKYFTDTVIPYFYNDYNEINPVKLYHKLFSDNDRFCIYICFVFGENFSDEKLIYYRNNMLNISSLDINDIIMANAFDVFNYTYNMFGKFSKIVDIFNDIHEKKYFKITPECCAETVEISFDTLFITDVYKKLYDSIMGFFSPEVKLNISQGA